MKIRKYINLIISIVMLSGVCMNALALVNCTMPQDLSATPVTKNVDYTTQIWPIFTANAVCTGCHAGAGAGGLLLPNANTAYTNLVNVTSTNQNAGIPRVTPYNEESSFLFKKINCTNLNTMVYGSRMPPGGALSLANQALILDWIQQGAKPAKVPDADYIFYSGFSRN